MSLWTFDTTSDVSDIIHSPPKADLTAIIDHLTDEQLKKLIANVELSLRQYPLKGCTSKKSKINWKIKAGSVFERRKQGFCCHFSILSSTQRIVLRIDDTATTKRVALRSF